MARKMEIKGNATVAFLAFMGYGFATTQGVANLKYKIATIVRQIC